MIIEVQGEPAYIDNAGRPPDPALPTIVLIHGALNDHTVWDAVATPLAASGCNVLAVDLPGHGRSGGSALTTIEAMADWLLAFHDAAAIPSALLAGHSMGSLIALKCAARAPVRVRGLALLGTTWPMRVSDALLTAALDDEDTAIDMVSQWSHADTEAGAAAIDATRSLMRRVADQGPAHLLHTDLNACNAYADGAAAAATIACPTLFVLGTQDWMTPARKARTAALAIAHARIMDVATGHAMLAEQPEAVTAALCAFAHLVTASTAD